jgi:hypothetical protein
MFTSTQVELKFDICPVGILRDTNDCGPTDKDETEDRLYNVE